MEAKTDSTNYERIADAIRRKNGSEDRYYPSEMPGAIDEIRTEPITVDDDLNPESENPVQNKAIVEGISEALDAANAYTDEAVQAMDDEKQNTLVSGENIKTVNGQTLLGDGDIIIGSGGTIPIDSSLRPSSENAVQNKVIWHALEGKQPRLVSGGNIKAVNGESILGAGDLTTPDTYLDSAEVKTVEVPVGDLLIESGTSNTDYTISNQTLSLSNVPESSSEHYFTPVVYFENNEITINSFTGEAKNNYIVIAKTSNGFILVNGTGGLYLCNNTGVSSSSEIMLRLSGTYLFSLPITIKMLTDSVLQLGDYTITSTDLIYALRNYDTFDSLKIGYSRKHSESACAMSFILPTTTEHVMQFNLNNNSSVEANVDALIPEERKPLKGLKLSIIGDSISTYQGTMPSGYASYYPHTDNSLDSVTKTWWYELISETGMEMLVNASWSGSTVCGDSTSTTNAFAACSTKRINDLERNLDEPPNIIICYIGINDFSGNHLYPIGNYTGETELPNEGQIETFSEGYALMLAKIMQKYPKATVFACSLLEVNRSNYDTDTTFPAKNYNGVTVSQYNARIKQLCENIGVNFIDLHSCGINYWNLNAYTGDGLHPNAGGAWLIKERIKAALLNDIK